MSHYKKYLITYDLDIFLLHSIKAIFEQDQKSVQTTAITNCLVKDDCSPWPRSSSSCSSISSISIGSIRGISSSSIISLTDHQKQKLSKI